MLHSRDLGFFLGPDWRAQLLGKEISNVRKRIAALKLKECHREDQGKRYSSPQETITGVIYRREKADKLDITSHKTR